MFENFLLRTLVHSLVTLGGGEWYPTGEAVRQLLLVGLAVRDCGPWPSSLYYINFLDPPVYEEANLLGTVPRERPLLHFARLNDLKLGAAGLRASSPLR